ncbi:hypothetical protein rosag_15040 [Roseisolibacter agri]|uniref:Uncharacterized protein n=1 Tax=Roseisolibacter agri TaxID=2014610 RepID=A0AA37Q8I5_9BACT|nr:hypothetical protein rosag_15040 [Roseisolibacter agri]
MSTNVIGRFADEAFADEAFADEAFAAGVAGACASSATGARTPTARAAARTDAWRERGGERIGTAGLRNAGTARARRHGWRARMGIATTISRGHAARERPRPRVRHGAILPA